MQRTLAIRIQNALLIFTLCGCLSTVGCHKGVETIWTTQIRSPDGQWIANARTDQSSGFGTDGAITAVYLTPYNGSRPPVRILSLSQNQNAQTSLIDLKMTWKDSTHLDVTYKEHPNLDFQAVKYAGIEISIHDISDSTVNSSH
jgi:hypothetical protein